MPTRLVRIALVLLVAVGVVASLGRALTAAHVARPVTEARLRATRGLSPANAREIDELEQHFADDRLATPAHVAAGGLFLALGLLQFSRGIRTRHRRFHRWSGRFLVAVAAVAGVSGLWMGIVNPFSLTERAPTAVGGILFLIAPAMAIAAIRRGDVVRHREWMIRFFSIALGVVVIRLISPAMLWLFAPATIRDLVGLTFWLGWLSSLATGECWIRATRARPSLLTA